MRMMLMVAGFVMGMAWFVLMPAAMPVASGPGEVDGVELLMAAEAGDVAALRWQLRRTGKSVDAEIGGTTLLTRAAAAGQVGVVRELVGMGADVNRAGSSGWTPLMAAVLFKQGEAVRALVECGARVDLTSHEGVNAVDVARGVKDEHIEAILVERI